MRRLATSALATLLCVTFLTNVEGCARWRRNRNQDKVEAAPPPRNTAADALARAEALRAQGLNHAALAEFERVIAINPELTIAYMGAAEIYAAEGNYEAAESNYGTAARQEPRNFNAQYGHGLMLQLLNRLTESVRAYLRALTIQPNDVNANLNLATAYLQLGEPAQALPYAERAVRLDRNNAAGRVNLGAVYAALNRHSEAVIEYQQAAELMELTPELLLNLADSLGKTERYAEMKETLEQLIELEPSAVAHERLASACFRLKDYDTALAEFRTAVEFDPRHYPALNGIGVCRLNTYLNSDKSDRQAFLEGQRALQQSLQIEHRQPRVRELLTRYR
jgi:tetratricopeptide (TPR) repeat protein